MSKDTIYREDAIKAINLRARIPHDVASAHYASMAINAICSVPSADRPQGKWIEHEWAEEVEGLLISNYECSECHSWERSASNYCPNCGADMRKGADDEVR